MARLVRKKKIFTKIDAFVSDSIDPGLFSIYGRVAEGVTLEKAEAALWHELELLQKQLVPKSEIEKVRNRFESEHIFRNLSGENLAGNLAVAEWRGAAESLFDEVASYRKVTPEEVLSAARELFRKGNSSVLYYRRKQK